MSPALSIIWALVHGVDPVDQEIDHKNCDKADNRIENLRIATRQQQGQNMPLPAHNKSGRKGVYFFDGKWCACVRHDGRTIHLGRFGTRKEAAQASRAFARRYHDEFYREE